MHRFRYFLVVWGSSDIDEILDDAMDDFENEAQHSEPQQKDDKSKIKIHLNAIRILKIVSMTGKL